jgi:hypothetical protein
VSQTLIAPPFTLAAQATQLLARDGEAVLSPADLAACAGVPLDALRALEPHWNQLVADAHLLDGGKYRERRHSCFELHQGQLTQTAHRAHWQPVEYNALHGGIQRWFEPMEAGMAASAPWCGLLKGLGTFANAIRPGVAHWFIEAHPFRIDASQGIGRPTPEGAHRDGVDLVVVVLIGRRGIKGGETRVFDASSPTGWRFTLTEPWTALLLDDARMIHETTPIQPLVKGQLEPAQRDTLVLTYRAGGFQGP